MDPAMKPWVGALVLPILLGITSGSDLRTESGLSIKSFSSGRASVSAGACSNTPPTVTIPVGDYANFTSPNYPGNYGPYQHCAWNFETDTGAQLWLSCDPVALSWFATLYVSVQGKTYTKTCLLCHLPDTFQYMIRSNFATVGLRNYLSFTNKGFSCQISSVLKPNNVGCKCGAIQTKRIVGGEETAPNQYPWMALIVTAKTNYSFCGGSLITDEFVLTAAHCTRDRSADTIQVRLGMHDMYTTPAAESLRRDVLQIITHPSYLRYSYNYDASLLRISAVNFSSHSKIRPICLPAGSNNYTGQQAITAGWGTTENGTRSQVLMDVTVPVISNSACNILLSNKVTDSMICAGSAGRDSCQGDSGGPLFLAEGSGYQVIIGIVSWGYGCGKAGYPGVYARTTAFKSWIVSQVEGSTVCSPP